MTDMNQNIDLKKQAIQEFESKDMISLITKFNLEKNKNKNIKITDDDLKILDKNDNKLSETEKKLKEFKNNEEIIEFLEKILLEVMNREKRTQNNIEIKKIIENYKEKKYQIGECKENLPSFYIEINQEISNFANNIKKNILDVNSEIKNFKRTNDDIIFFKTISFKNNETNNKEIKNSLNKQISTNLKIINEGEKNIEQTNKNLDDLSIKSRILNNELGGQIKNITDINIKRNKLLTSKDNLDKKVKGINNILNESNLSKEEKNNLEIIKTDLEKKIEDFENQLENYQDDLFILNGEIQDFKKALVNLKTQYKNELEKTKDYKEKQLKLIQENKEKTQQIKENVKEIDIKINENDKNQLKKMLTKAKEMKNANPSEYKNFIDTVRQSTTDGNISTGDWKPWTENEMAKIKKSFKKLEKAYSGNINIIINNLINGKDFSQEVKNALSKYLKKNYNKNKKDVNKYLDNFNKIIKVIKANSILEDSVLYKKLTKNIIKNCKNGDLLKNSKYLEEQLKLLTGDGHKIYEFDKETFKSSLEKTKKLINKIKSNSYFYNYKNHIIKILGNIDINKINEKNYIKNYIEKIQKNDGVLGINYKNIIKINQLNLKLEDILNLMKNYKGTKLNNFFYNFKSEKEILNNINNKVDNIKIKLKKISGLNENNKFGLGKFDIIIKNKVNEFKHNEILNNIATLKNFDSFLIFSERYLNILEKVRNNKNIDSKKKTQYTKLIFDLLNSGDINFLKENFTYINEKAISLGLDRDKLNQEISNLEQKLLEKINKKNILFDDDSILKSFNSLKNLKKNNKLVYLKVLGQIYNNGIVTADDITNGLDLWNKIIKKELQKNSDNSSKFENLNFEQLNDKYLQEFAKKGKDEEKEISAFEPNKALDFVNNTIGLDIKTPIKTNYNEKIAKIYKKQALLMLNNIDKNEKDAWYSDDEKVENAKKLILFALENNAFGDIRIINALKILSHESEKEKIKTETKDELDLEKKFTNEKGELNLFIQNEGNIKLLANNEKNPLLLEECDLGEFKTKFINSLKKGEIISFIQQKPKASMSFFSYIMTENGKNVLTLKEKLLLAQKYQEFQKEIQKENLYIMQATGKNSFILEMARQFGEKGQIEMMAELIEKLKSKDQESINFLNENKKLIIESIKNNPFIDSQRRIDLIKQIKQINNIKVLKKTSEYLEKLKDNKEALFEIVKGKIEEKKFTSFITKLSEILQHKGVSTELKIFLDKSFKSPEITKKIGKKLSELSLINQNVLNNLESFVNIKILKQKKEKGENISFEVEKGKKLNKEKNNTETKLAIVKKVDFSNQNIDNQVENYKNSKDFKDIKEKLNKEENENNKNIEILANSDINSKEYIDAEKKINYSIEKSDIKNTLETSKIVKDLEKKGIKFSKKLMNNLIKERNKAIKKAIIIAKENPEKSDDLRKILKNEKEYLEKKGNLTKEEKNTLIRIKKYDLDDPKMPIKILSKENTEDIKNAIKNNSGKIKIGETNYIASGKEGNLALLDKDNGYIVIIEGTEKGNEVIELTENEKSTIGENPEGIGAFAEFRRLFVKLGMPNIIWENRDSIFTAINSVNSSFKINSKEYLSENNKVVFIKSILKSTGKPVLTSNFLNDNIINFKKQNLTNGGFEETHDTNIYGDGEIERIFIEKFSPRGSLLGFDKIKFVKSLSNSKNQEK